MWPLGHLRALFTEHNPAPTARLNIGRGGEERKGPETQTLLALGHGALVVAAPCED